MLGKNFYVCKSCAQSVFSRRINSLGRAHQLTRWAARQAQIAKEVVQGGQQVCAGSTCPFIPSLCVKLSRRQAGCDQGMVQQLCMLPCSLHSGSCLCGLDHRPQRQPEGLVAQDILPRAAASGNRNPAYDAGMWKEHHLSNIHWLMRGPLIPMCLQFDIFQVEQIILPEGVDELLGDKLLGLVECHQMIAASSQTASVACVKFCAQREVMPNFR